MDEVITQIVDGRVTHLIDYVKQLSEVVKLNTQIAELNTQVTNKLELFVKTVADLSFKAVEIGKNNYNAMSGYFARISERLDIVELIQYSHFEFIESVQHLTYYSIGIGLLNTTLILIIGIYLISKKN